MHTRSPKEPFRAKHRPSPSAQFDQNNADIPLTSSAYFTNSEEPRRAKLEIDIEMGFGEMERIVVYEGDSPSQLAFNFI